MSEQTRLDEMRDQVSAFHNKHPEVWDLFVKFSFEMITKRDTRIILSKAYLRE